jgi:rSAM/selenodomain-associated transferase 2
MVSIIIPTYNEASGMAAALERLSRLRGPFEVIVADGESADATCSLVMAASVHTEYPLRLVRCECNRGQQLNLGAKLARGEALLFLHADVQLAPKSIQALEVALRDPGCVGGNFHLVFDGNDFWSRVFTWVNRLRRRWGIYYGDSGLFVRRAVFAAMGGFKPFPIMDDYEFVRRLERRGRTVCLPSVVSASARRWRAQGVVRTLFSWVFIQGLYSIGVPPEHLARWYKPVRVRANATGARPCAPMGGEPAPERAKS